MSAAMRLRPLTAVLIVAVSVAIVALAACHVESAPTVVAPPPLPPLPPPLPSLPNQPPVADAGGPYTGGDTAAIAFDGTRSFDPDDDLPLDYTWDFGDGNTAIGATPAHAYAAAGVYRVTLTVTDARGARSTPVITTAVLTAAASAVLLAAGDIASCGVDSDELTAQILDTMPGTVLTLGDNAFPDATLSTYLSCYDPNWGRHKAHTYATLGNHEYTTGTAAGAFDYFGDRAGPRDKGYYSFDLGAWHVIVLNSNGSFVPFSTGSEQDQWLQADLAASTKQCTLAAWHHPLFFSSREAGYTSEPAIKAIWSRLYAAGVDVVLNAQMHHYERFAPLSPDGAVDSARGIKEFNVGTGGASVALPTVIAANSETVAGAFGVLTLTLYPDRYTWRFVSTAGETFADSGSGACH